MIYVERYPEELNHDQLASIFKRAGSIKHVSMPRYKESRTTKGFAFIEFANAQEAQ